MIMSIVYLATYAAVHSSVYFGEPSLIAKLLPCAYYDTMIKHVLLLISLLLHALISATYDGMRL